MSRFERLRSHYQRAKTFYLKYERLLMPATLAFGFLVDYFTFTNIQINTAFTVLLIYWFVAGLIILFIHLYDGEKISGSKLRYARLFAPLLIQFFFGALLGGSFIFYWFSGTISVSWPIILIMVFLMVGNDFFRKHYVKPLVQISIYFFITFSLFSVILPFTFNSLSAWLFIAAGLISLIIIYLYVRLLSKIRYEVKETKGKLFASVGAIFLIMNFFYFANMIPPIPLSIREAGLYHRVERSGGNTYTLTGEPESFWQKIWPGQTLRLAPGERAYVYTAIFAPADLKTTIVHHWQYYDPDRKTWVSRDKISFPVTGGRQEGYRGYSYKTSYQPGKWRVYVQTERGQTLGRIKFNIEKVDQPVELEESIR